MPFTTISSIPAKVLFDGAIRGHYAHLDHVTLGEVDLAAGTVVPVHQHPHEQVTYVVEGRLEFTIDGESRVLERGDAAVIPGGAAHGCRALTRVLVVDVFSPARDDYR